MTVPMGKPAAGPVVTVEPMRWWDLEAVHDLETQLFTDDPWTLGQLWSELARVPATRWYLVARHEGDLVGYAGAFLAGDEADVQTVAVAGPAQGRGIGARLVRSLADWARSRGARVLHLEVRADNDPALGLYGHLGFTVVGRRRDYYGRGRDAVLMTLPLERAEEGEHG